MSRYTITAGTDVLEQSDVLALGEHLPGVQWPGYREHRFRKYFVGAPVGPPLAVVARDEDGSPVGSGVLHPRPLLVEGNRVSAAVSGDFVVAPSHRTLGLAIRIQRSLLELAETNGIELVLGHPNDAARPILCRMGYRSLVQRAKHVRFFGRGIPARSRRRRLAYSSARILDSALQAAGPERLVRRGGEVHWVDRFDEAFTEVWSAASEKSRVISERTAVLLNWRYELQPGVETGRFRLATFGRDGEVRAYLVLFEDGSTWRLMEVAGVDGRSQEVLLAGVLAHARTAGAAGLVLSSFAISDELARALRRLQFVRRKTPAALLAREVSGTCPWAVDATGWVFTVGDLDP